MDEETSEGNLYDAGDDNDNDGSMPAASNSSGPLYDIGGDGSLATVAVAASKKSAVVAKKAPAKKAPAIALYNFASNDAAPGEEEGGEASTDDIPLKPILKLGTSPIYPAKPFDEWKGSEYATAAVTGSSGPDYAIPSSSGAPVYEIPVSIADAEGAPSKPWNGGEYAASNGAAASPHEYATPLPASRSDGDGDGGAVDTFGFVQNPGVMHVMSLDDGDDGMAVGDDLPDDGQPRSNGYLSIMTTVEA